MTQLTSDAASVSLYHTWYQRQISTGHATFYSEHSARAVPRVFPTLTAYLVGRLALPPSGGLYGLPFASGSSIRGLHRPGLSFGYALRRRRGVDLNHLDRCAAARFYCEYRTRERIHRSVADLRLLAIPAS